MKGQRKIRGVDNDTVWLTIAPDPLGPPTPMLHVAVNSTHSEVAMFTLAGARRLHSALGELLDKPTRQGRRAVVR